jgi:uncharacterized protein YaaN involved in tellurite resistance
MINIPEEERHYFPTIQQQTESGLISIESMRKTMGDFVKDRTDSEIEDLREKFYTLAYFLYYDWIDSMKK